MSSSLREDFYFASTSDVYGTSHPPDPCEMTAWMHIKTGYSYILFGISE